MAYDGQARRAQKHHPDLPALTRSRTEPGRERLAVSPPELALKHRLRKLRRHPRRCDAWRRLIAQPERITSIGMPDRAHIGRSNLERRRPSDKDFRANSQ